MKTTTLTMLLTLLVAMPAAADQPTLRYQLPGTLQLRMEQDMYPGGRTEPIADRRFDMTFEFADSDIPGAMQAELASIKGTYSAHGMNQILSTRHLVGQEVPLSSDGQTINVEAPGGDIDLGLVTDGGLHPSAVLVDVLPVLPEGPVSNGMTWETKQPLSSLEGWAWAEGDMQYTHEITGITNEAGRTLVHVTSQGSATTVAAAGRTGFVGEGNIERRMEWTFDVTAGQLLSLSLQQEGTGTNQLPQGQVQVRQVTRVELNSA
jgi:hypothetical protein